MRSLTVTIDASTRKFPTEIAKGVLVHKRVHFRVPLCGGRETSEGVAVCLSSWSLWLPLRVLVTLVQNSRRCERRFQRTRMNAPLGGICQPGIQSGDSKPSVH